MDKLVAMRTFCRVVEIGSFAGAARDLRLSNAAVSKHVSELEAHLGATLLVRTTRQLSLTDAGRGYFERCARTLEDIAEAEAAVGELQAAPRGILRVNAPMSFGLLHLSPAIPAFMARFPEVRVDLSMNDRVVDIVEGGFDLAVRGRASLPDSSLVARRLTPIRRLLCAAPGYLERHGVPEKPEELRRHRCLVYSLSSLPTQWDFRSARGEEAVVEVEGWYTANSSLALRDALVAGIGVGLAPTFIIGPDVAARRLVPLLPDWTAAERSLYVVYPQNRHLSPKVRSFVDFLVERFGPEPPWDAGLNLDQRAAG